MSRDATSLECARIRTFVLSHIEQSLHSVIVYRETTNRRIGTKAYYALDVWLKEKHLKQS